MKKTPIFVITTLREPKKKIINGSIIDQIFPVGSTRSVGFYYSLRKAIKRVEENAGDIYEEGYYPYVVIERTPEGVYPDIRREYWFTWDKEKGKYCKSERPKVFDHIACFGLG